MIYTKTIRSRLSFCQCLRHPSNLVSLLRERCLTLITCFLRRCSALSSTRIHHGFHSIGGRERSCSGCQRYRQCLYQHRVWHYQNQGHSISKPYSINQSSSPNSQSVLPSHKL